MGGLWTEKLRPNNAAARVAAGTAGKLSGIDTKNLDWERGVDAGCFGNPRPQLLKPMNHFLNLSNYTITAR